MTANTNGKATTKTRKPKQEPTSVEARLAKQQKQIDTLAWLLAGLLHELRMVIAQQLLSNPQVQQQLQQELLAKMQGGQQ